MNVYRNKQNKIVERKVKEKSDEGKHRDVRNIARKEMGIKVMKSQ
jgi:hypothetical protein